MIGLPIFLVVLSIGCISGHRSVVSEHSASLVKADVDESVEGIDDYHKADEYSDSWLDPLMLEETKKQLLTKIEDLSSRGDAYTEDEKKDMMQKVWLIANQELLQAASMGCTNLCAMCVPPSTAFAHGGDVELKTVFVDRNKGWIDAMKMPVVAPIDAAAGAVGGALGGLAVGLGAGVITGGLTAVGTDEYVMRKTNHSAAGIILGSLAGISTGAVTTAAVLVAAEIFLPLRGVFKGAGLTGMLTECSRVGFEASVNGVEKEGESFENKFMRSEYGLKTLRKKMGYDKEWFTKAPGREQSVIIARDSERAQQSLDYGAISHCEYLRLGKFDVRHVLECIKHRLLCGSSGAILLPTNSKGTCQAMSDSAELEDQAKSSGMADDLSDMWKDAKDRVACVKMLCDYKGFKRAALKTHPDRVNNMPDLTEDEKQKLINQFKFMNTCTDRFKTAQGGPLTLNTKEERDEMCRPQD